MKQVKRAGEMVTEEALIKNKFADPMEAAEYAWWGGGEDTRLVEKPVDEGTAIRHDQPSRRSILTRGRRRAG